MNTIQNGLRAITVCVDYSDLLSLTYTYNKHHFSQFGVVTSHTDTKTRDFCYRNNLWCYVTDDFYKNGASFNKWLSMENALDMYGRTGWLCLMDADVLWPKFIPPIDYQVGKLYTPLRRMFNDVSSLKCGLCAGSGITYKTDMTLRGDSLVSKESCQICNRLGYIFPPEMSWLDYPIHRNIAEWAGYSQIFHADDPVLGNPPWHQIDWKHAGGADSFFQQKWHPRNKIRPSFEVLHLGQAGKNWFGRSTPYLDGTVHPESSERLNSAMGIWGERRKRERKGTDPFELEKIHNPTE